MRVQWVDGAKGIAILMVISVHLSQALTCLPSWGKQIASFGAMGVQLFFIMSAYCLCMTWNPKRFDRFYWWCKYKRLICWYASGVAIYYLYWSWRGDVQMLSSYTVGNVFANLFFVNGFIPSAQNSIVPGGWSISCIALFVFLFPLLTLVQMRIRHILLVSLSVLGCGISVVGYYYCEWSRFFAYCVPLNQIAPFAIGVFFWEKHEALKRVVPPILMVFGCVFFFLSAVAGVLFARDASIFYRQTLVSCSFAFALMLFERYEQFIPRWLIWTGKHSYEIFILHFVAIWMLFGCGGR